MFLVVGSRVEDDQVGYLDDDFQWLEDKASGRYISARKDRSAYSDDDTQWAKGRWRKQMTSKRKPPKRKM